MSRVRRWTSRAARSRTARRPRVVEDTASTHIDATALRASGSFAPPGTPPAPRLKIAETRFSTLGGDATVIRSAPRHCAVPPSKAHSSADGFAVESSQPSPASLLAFTASASCARAARASQPWRARNAFCAAIASTYSVSIADTFARYILTTCASSCATSSSVEHPCAARVLMTKASTFAATSLMPQPNIARIAPSLYPRATAAANSATISWVVSAMSRQLFCSTAKYARGLEARPVGSRALP